ncbi:MAG: inorganic diphosphatase [Caedimonas sp.]|nr:inorganic diphosphatase [Caedimonas sp.]
MNLDHISAGKNLPWDVNVLIEIPYGGAPVKYEIDKDSGALFVDRFLHTAMYYPANYGFIPHTLADDGDPLDALVTGKTPVIPGAIIRSRPIGVLFMEDESGGDEKLLMVPVDKLNPYYSNIKDYQDLPVILRDQIVHFFKHYKDLEAGKWVNIKRWGSAQEAAELILKCYDRQ